MATLAELQAQWTQLYSKTLPSLARGRDQAQYKWPVTLDHCFARIILDNTIGEGQEQWDKRLKKPAVRNMSEVQLKAAIELGEQIQDGSVDLVALDMQSLEARGKGEKKYKQSSTPTTGGKSEYPTTAGSTVARKRKVSAEEVHTSASHLKRPKAEVKRQSTIQFASQSQPTQSPPPPKSESVTEHSAELQALLYKITAHPTLTPYRKRLYCTLLSVPRGRYTTYAAMSEYLNSSARAVGSGMRNNPFAPEVPCHRVLAADGSIGGFGGSWGKDGEHAPKKLKLLGEEGVRFDSKGKVKGMPWRDFVDLGEPQDVSIG